MSRYRFLLRPKWLLFHLVVIGGVVLMVNLGFWQLRRLDERRQFNREVETRIDQPVAPLDDVLGPETDPSTVEWRPVSATGTYLNGEDVVVVNRSQGGQVGDLLVTPLELDDGRLLLVERGFVPIDTPVPPPPPSGPVAVVGRLRPSQQRRTGGLSDPAEGDLTIVQRIDLPRLAEQLPGPLVPVWIELVSSEPPEAGPIPTPVNAPELGERNHLSYAVQWFIFATCVAAGWILAVRKSAATADRSPPADRSPTQG